MLKTVLREPGGIPGYDVAFPYSPLVGASDFTDAIKAAQLG